MKKLIITLFFCIGIISIVECQVSLTKREQAALIKKKKIEEEKKLFHSAEVAYMAEDYQKAIVDLTALLGNQNTPHWWDASFLRAIAYIKLGKPEKALDDYANISLANLGNNDPILYFRVLCQIGDAYVAMQEYGKAANAYGNPTMELLKDKKNRSRLKTIDELTPNERKVYLKLLEYATFMSVCCLHKVDNKKETERILNLYKREFPKGKYKDKLNNIPIPEEALMKSRY